MLSPLRLISSIWSPTRRSCTLTMFLPVGNAILRFCQLYYLFYSYNASVLIFQLLFSSRKFRKLRIRITLTKFERVNYIVLCRDRVCGERRGWHAETVVSALGSRSSHRNDAGGSSSVAQYEHPSSSAQGRHRPPSGNSESSHPHLHQLAFLRYIILPSLCT